MCRHSRDAAECDAGQVLKHHRRMWWPGRRTGAGPADDQWLSEPENQALEHFHDHGGQSDWLIIVEACYARLLKNGRYGGVKHRGTWHCSSDLVNRAAVANWRRQLMTSGRGGAVGEDRPWELEEARRDDEGAPQILKMSVI